MTSTSSSNDTLLHPEFGELPARRLLDCVFALSPEGRILHFHTEQMEIEKGDASTCFRLTDKAPDAERSRCQIIPPLVNSFRQQA